MAHEQQQQLSQELMDELLVLESMFPEVSYSNSILKAQFPWIEIEILDLQENPRLFLKLLNPLVDAHFIIQELTFKFNQEFKLQEQPLLRWFEYIQSYNFINPQPHQPPAASDLPSIPSDCPLIHHSEPLFDKKSVFIAHAACVESMEQMNTVKSVLLSDKKISKATHNITAYRFMDSCTNTIKSDHDDDGEDAAGGRLMHMLQSANVMNVFIMVSRWYGGVQLGPQRFKDINNVARGLLESMEMIPDKLRNKK